MKYLKLLLGICLCLLPVGEQTIAAQNPRQTVRVGVYDNNPKVFLSENQQPQGFWVDIVDEIGKQENWLVIYSPCEWSQCLKQLQRGELDLMVDVAYSPERDRIFDFNNEVVLASWSQVYTRQGLEVQTILDLEGKKVGILAGSIQQELIEEEITPYGITIELKEFKSFNDIFIALEKGDVDAVIVNNFNGSFALSKFNVNKSNILLDPARLHFIVKDSDPKSLLSQVDHTLEKLINNADSVYYEAQKKWLEPEAKLTLLSTKKKIIELSFYFPFIALILLLLWNYFLKKEVDRRIYLEGKLKESQQRYASLASGVAVGIFRTNDQHQCIYVNQYYTQLTGISFEDAIAGKWVNILHPEDRDSVMRLWQNSIKKKEILTLEHRFLRPDGKTVWVYSQCLPEHDLDGKFKGYIGTLTDISDRKLAELALKESEQRFCNMAANVPGAIFRYILHPDYTDQIIYMSDGCYELWEIDSQKLMDSLQIIWDLVNPDDLPAMKESVINSAKTLQPWFHQWRITTPSGRKKWLEGCGKPKKEENGDVIWDSFIMDVSDRKQAEIALAESEERFRLVTENMSDLVCLLDNKGKYIYITPSCYALLGYSPEELMNYDPKDLFHPDDYEIIRQNCPMESINTLPLTYRTRHKLGHYIWLETISKGIYDEDGQLLYIQSTSRDVSDRISMENQLKHDALHDKLTGLPNRHLLTKRLDLALKRSRRYKQAKFAVLFFDLDNFKLVNDSLGHLIGDELLINIAVLLRNFIRETDLAARLGGDEFVVLLEEIKHIQEAFVVAQRIIDELRSPLEIENREVFTSTSIGIVIGSEKHHTPEDVLRDADIAMYRAKQGGKGKYAIFDPQMHSATVERLHLENDLRKALKENQFLLYYQPIINIECLSIEGFEILLRWQHPEKGIITPDKFIYVIEEMGLMNSLGEWIFETACQQLFQWQNQLKSSLKININLSVTQLQPSLLSLLESTLAKYPIRKNTLVLEITEGMLIKDFANTNQLLAQIKEKAIGISIDDFGTGYSCLGYLHQLSVDALKIDGSFMNFSNSNNYNQVIVASIISLAKSLGLRVIAEGIETEEQRQWLIDHGCKLGQGYLFFPPVSPEKATQFLR